MADETETGTRMAPDDTPCSQQKMVADETQTGTLVAPDEMPPRQAFHTNANGEKMLNQA